MKNILKNILFAFVVILASYGITNAGNLFPSAATVSSTFYTLGDVYNKLIDNTASVSEGDHDLTSSATPVSTFHTLKDIYEAIPDLDAGKIVTGTTYMGVVGTMLPSTPLKTGQTLCYDVSGNPISCTGTGQDGDYQAGQARSYTDNEDDTIIDNSTGLMWKKCSEGLSGDDCETGSATTMTWTTATSTCENDTTAGYTDWRLPNIKELLSIVDYGKIFPTIDTTIFPATVSDYYWSSTTYLGYPSSAWNVYFFDGDATGGGKIYEGYVRCVR